MHEVPAKVKPLLEWGCLDECLHSGMGASQKIDATQREIAIRKFNARVFKSNIILATLRLSSILFIMP